MSTKDISRSAVEGGRYSYNKYERNESHRHERARAKVWLDKVRVDDEAAEGSDPVPRNKVHKGFTDNLGPCYGWLASRWEDIDPTQEGRPRRRLYRLTGEGEIAARRILDDVEARQRGSAHGTWNPTPRGQTA